MLERKATQGALARGASLLLSAAALLLGAAHAGASEWHYQWGSTPVIQPPVKWDHAFGTCPYSLPAGVPAQYASVGVRGNHSWLELQNWTTSLGYSPEAMSYHLCSNNQSAAWISSPFFALWSVARPPTPLNPGVASGPDYPCPDERPNIVAAFCQSRSLW